MLAGWLLGHYVVDSYLGSSPWGGIALTLAGAAVGFYEIWQILMKERGSGTRMGPDDRA